MFVVQFPTYFIQVFNFLKNCLVTVDHASRDRNTNKQRFTLRIVNILVIILICACRQTSSLPNCKLHGHF